MDKKIFIQNIFSLWIMCAVTFSQWSDDPASPQLLGSGVQSQVGITSDGGVYFAWLTDGSYHVYLQYLNPQGIAQLGDVGMLISDNNNSSWIAVYHLNLAVDSEDNAIITVVDQRTGPWQVYAYKVAPDGTMLWGTDGLTLSSSNMDNISPRLAIFPDNSIVVSWSKNYSSIITQCISADGDLLWGDGIAINSLMASLLSPHPIMSADGHLLLQWISQTGSVWAADSKLHLQKYNLDGSVVWEQPTVVMGPEVFPMGNWLQQSVADGNNGSFSAWTEMSGNAQSALTQHINENGDLSLVGSVELSLNSSNFRMSPRLVVAENSQELMAVWNESNGSQSQRGVYAQRLDGDGNRIWGMNGKPVIALNNNYDYLDLSNIAVGEDMITTYIQQSPNMTGDIYATRLNTNGNTVWLGGNIEITNSNNPKSDMMVSKGQGCLFISWTENGNVYAHRLKENGELGPPDIVVLGDANGDGQLNVLDIVMTASMILSEEYAAVADINEDGELNILDIVMLVNWILYGIPDNTVEDIDGNIYSTIQIGEQIWMAENLKVTHFNNGDAIPAGYSDEEWSDNWNDAYAVYEDDPSNAHIYGNLYNGFAVNDNRGICPENYHIPSDDEWYVLLEYLGGYASGFNENSIIAGGKMKELGTIEDGNGLWYAPNDGANNASGFTSIPGGFRPNDGEYIEKGFYSAYWSSTEEYYANALFMWYLYNDTSLLYRGMFDWQAGLSVRCIHN